MAVAPKIQVISIVFGIFAQFPFAIYFFPRDFRSKAKMAPYVVNAPAFVGAEHEGAIRYLLFEFLKVGFPGLQQNIDHTNDRPITISICPHGARGMFKIFSPDFLVELGNGLARGEKAGP